MKRPFALLGFSCLFGAIAAFYLNFTFIIVILIIAFILFLINLFLKLKLKKNIFVILIVFILSVFAFNFYSDFFYKPLIKYQGKKVMITGVSMDKIRDNDKYPCYKVKTTSINGEKLPKPVNIIVYSINQIELFRDFSSEIEIYSFDIKDTYSGNKSFVDDAYLSGFLSQEDAFNENGINEENFYFNDNQNNKYYFEKALYSLTEKGKSSLLNSADKNYGGVLKGIITGDKSDISSEQLNNYRKSGISHVFAVSGLHLSITVSFLLNILKKMKLKKWINTLISIAFILFFISFTGFSTSVIRSGIMMIIYLSAMLFSKSSDSLNSLGFAALFILISSPFYVGNIGFLLSVFSTLGIIVLHPILEKRIIRKLKIKSNILKSVISCFSISIASSAFVLPITIFSFSEISLIAPVTNVIITFIVPFLLAFGLIICALSFFSSPLFLIDFFGEMAKIFIMILNGISNFLADLPYSVINTSNILIKIWIIIFVLTIVIFSLNKISLKRIKNICFLFFIVFFIGFISFNILTFNDSNLILFEDEESSAVLLEHDKKVILITDGLSRSLTYNISLYLNKVSIHEIDFCILTHQNSKTNLALTSLSNNVKIKNISSNEEIPQIKSVYYSLENINLKSDDTDLCYTINYRGDTAIILNIRDKNILFLTENADINNLLTYDKKIKNIDKIDLIILNKNPTKNIDKLKYTNSILLNKNNNKYDTIKFENKLLIKI